MLYWLLHNPKSKGAWISPIYNQSKKVFQELSNAAHKIMIHSNKADLTMEFLNGSTLQFLSAERYDSIRGFSFSHMVVDEAAFIKEIAMQEAIFPTLSALGKKCLIISTPKSKNWFYNAYLKGSTGGSDYVSFRGVSTDNPHISQQFINEQSKSLPPEIFKQEYLAQFSESGNDVFTGVDVICILNGWTPAQTGKRYYAGIDLGLQNDYSVLTIMDESGRVARVERVNGTSYTDIVSTFGSILRPYRIAGGYTEINGPGLPVFEMLRKEDRRLRSWTTTNSNKGDGIRNLIYDIQGGKLELPDKDFFPHLYNELSAFSYKVSATGLMTFNAPSGLHDDTVMSLMLANEARRNVHSASKIYVGGLVK
tara:strand:+ start:5 stop:1102 length:1098 start_codon:yes stop_codon:yes gene_type:complete